MTVDGKSTATTGSSGARSRSAAARPGTTSTEEIANIDLEMSADIAMAAASDSVEDTLNYKSVAKRIRQFVEESSFQLVETLAERIAAIVRDEFDVQWVKVRVNKPGAIRGSKDVGVLIERGNWSD